MRRSICVCEPLHCYAGEVRTFRFHYTPAINLPKGAKIRFDLGTEGRQIDWQTPQINPKDKKNMIWMELSDGKTVIPKLVEKEEGGDSLYEFITPIDIKAGDSVVICLGSISEEREKGSRAQLSVQRRKPFHLFVDPRGKNDFKEEETFHLDIRGNTLHRIRILAPSIVAKNKRFDVLVRFEDAFGNLTSYAPEGSLIELSYENQRGNLNWKLFIPETGFINLPNLYFNEPGIYKIQLENLKNQEKYYSSPIKCLADSQTVLCWGTFHGESEKNNSQNGIEASLREFRDEKAFQFYGASPFESLEETSNESWKLISQQSNEFNEDQRFSSFLGFQYPCEEGLRQVVYFKDQRPLLRQKDAKSSSLTKLHNILTPKEGITIPQMSMAKGFETDFSTVDSDVEKVIEIYNAWGSSECSSKEGNPRPIRSSAKKGVQETESGSIIKALCHNKRLGFVAGGFDTRDLFARFLEPGQAQYSAGLTAVLSHDHTRESIAQAVLNRSCYATTGARIIVGFYIAGAPMGSELNTKVKPGLAINRHISGYICGTCALKEVALVRNGMTIQQFAVEGDSLSFTYDDMEPLAKIALAGGSGKTPFAFYYLRITQVDDHIAWSSPIWVDSSEGQITPVKKGKGK
ncbi:MAG: DUF3604 domain-containing protein [Candidatus Rhabdochlamydia sp.]